MLGRMFVRSMRSFIVTVRPLFDVYAWMMVIIGGVMFCAEVPMEHNRFVNLPVLVTLLQITGGIFIICGFSLIVTRLFWSKARYDDLHNSVLRGNVAAAVMLAGIKMFAGLTILACAVWLAFAFNGSGR